MGWPGGTGGINRKCTNKNKIKRKYNFLSLFTK